ncbi:DUF2264 domain-containing protein [Aquibacillus albus]|uniref:DUF2264 domain-containing protein n=1 Tax=Aquibacillus albus TaxID=1168171 RepID=A0ABS2MX22_9BACI|nr:DUF2264 domain-containing protein [Aquibacillus albus]MBM7570323.1 hypothetical protein [Aquibacillus albus]
MDVKIQNDRQYWIDTMIKIASPVLNALEQKQLKEVMPVEEKEGASREKFSHLEAMSRLLVGIAPWLEKKSVNEKEEKLRLHFCNLARAAMDAGTDPASPDYMNFKDDFQPIVDTAFLAQAILRAPNELWEKLGAKVQQNVIEALKGTRSRKPVFSNWLLFSAIIEATLYKIGEDDWDPMRIDYALKQFSQWYVGDGVYSDGPEFHYDYYNAFVIHPMLVDLIETVENEYRDWGAIKSDIVKRSQRYAVIQERLISPEGTFPPVGRSLAYRCGALQSLSLHALRSDLPENVRPAQIRSALTAVIRKSLEAIGTFTPEGWLTIGVCGHQPGIGEGYISTGSTYLCSTIFLPLGLSELDPFWSDPPMDWTAKSVWSGQDVPIDHAL